MEESITGEYSLSLSDTNVLVEKLFYDSVYLRYLLENEKDCELLNYVEEHFPSESDSQKYQIALMLKYPFFGNKILENEEMSNDEKQEIFFRYSAKSEESNKGRIILIAGEMGGGKTGFGCWGLDEIREEHPYLKIKYFFVTTSSKHPELPQWFKIVGSIDDVEDNSYAFIDEGVLSMNARSSGSRENIETSKKLVQLRQRGITLEVATQNILMVDINIRRLATIIIIKSGATMQSSSREINHEENKDLELIRARLKARSINQAYMEIPSKGIYLNFTHPLPKWWDDEKVSKYMKGWDLKKERQKEAEQKKKEIEEEQKKQIEFARKKAEAVAGEYSKAGLKSPKIKQKISDDFEREELLG